jgi:hypothetical protein
MLRRIKAASEHAEALSDMTTTRRIFVSLPSDAHLSKGMNDLKWGIVEEIEKLKYVPEIFTNPRGKPGLASAKAWSARDADSVARRCHGAAILGFPRWSFSDNSGKAVLLPSEFTHYEGALTRTLGLPSLVLVQRDVMRRVVFDPSYAGFVGEFDANATLEWLHTDEFRVPFGYWVNQLEERRDVFLGYCSQSSPLADAIKQYLLSIGVSVLDWQTDFIPGRTILDQIETAAGRTLGGIFLFTKDDDLMSDTQTQISVPRDNVVFEAGYFVGLKGKHNVLILREHGSKMPADLGGDIYGALNDRTSIEPIKRTLQAFIGAL